MTQPPDHPQYDRAAVPDPAHPGDSAGPGTGDRPLGPPFPLARREARATRRRRVGVLAGAGALLLAAIAVVAVVGGAGHGHGDDRTRQVADRGAASAVPTPSRTAETASRTPSPRPTASRRSTRHRQPPAHRPPARLTDRVDWSPFEHAYGAATEPAAGTASTRGGVTQLRASRSFGSYAGGGLASVTADARYFGTAGQARGQYDQACGAGGGKRRGSSRTVTAGDRACSYVSDVSNGSSGTVILYVQVLRGNVLLQVAPEAFHRGSWSGTDLATLRAATVRCAAATAAHL